MKKRKNKVLLVCIAATVILAMFIGISSPVLAGDTYPYVGESAKGENQPYQHGYRIEDIMEWSPETDPYAGLLRAQIPLLNRNEVFAPTQANPELGSEAQYLTLTGDYGNAFFNSYHYTNEFSTHIFNFWQYIDYYASWHGMPSVGTPEELNDVEDERNATDGNAWARRYFEFGLVNLPNPAYTNAAHKNGVLSLGCMFQPRAYQNFEVMLYQDENGRYPVADKMTELAEYYGFDGYFFNMEGRSYSSDVKTRLREFLAQMREDGMYIQWYNAGSFNAQMLTDLSGRKAADSMFIEYGHTVPGDSVGEGLDKYEVAFSGYEAGRDRFSNDFSRMLSNGVMNGSIASLGTDFVQTGLEQTVRYDEETGLRLFTRELDEYQWMAFERERLWWTGNHNNRTTVLDPGLSEDASTVEASDFAGVADYIAERSVIGGKTFVTNFNTGHGLEYAVNGEISSKSEWSNINIQDILPTWQWWFETDGNRLSAEFDYGKDYRKVYNGGEETTFDFKTVGAYNGGSSLAVYGKLDARNFLHLYKTDLDVSDTSRMSVIFKKVSGDNAVMKLGVIFESAPETLVSFDLENTQKAGEWITSEVDFSDYAGESIAVIGLIFEGSAADYQMNLGQIKYTSGGAIIPDMPTGLTIEKAYETGEIIIAWDMVSYDQVKQYNIYGLKDGDEHYLGGIYDNKYYIKNTDEVLDHEQVTIILKAVSEDGTESEGATVTYNYGETVKNIVVDHSTDGQLTITWEGGEADVTVTTAYEKEPRTWTGSGTNGCVIVVPTGTDANGADITVIVTPKNGESIMADSVLPDEYCPPYDGVIWSDGCFTQPSTSEWYVLNYQEVTDGKRSDVISFQRGGGDWSTFDKLPDEIDGVYVWLEDYNGTISEEIYLSRTESDMTDTEKPESETDSESMTPASADTVPANTAASDVQESQTSNKSILIIGASLLILAAIIAGVFMYQRRKSGKY